MAFYRKLQDRAGGERLLEQLMPHAALNAIGPTYSMHGAVAHYIGLLHDLLGRGQQARHYLDNAVEQNSRLHMPLQPARSRSERPRIAAL